MILVTGASDGLGKEIARIYKEAGKTVVNLSRRESEFADHNLLHDLSQGSGIEAAVGQIQELDEPIEALINCVGVWSEQPIGEITESEIKRLMSSNLKSNMLLTSLLIEDIKRDKADVVSVVSTAGTKPSSHHPAYAASKWAQRGYTLSLQDELRPTKCRVISFCPGGIKTRLFEKDLGTDITDDETTWMDPRDLAVFIKQILDLPKSIEVSEVIVNRKKNA